MVYCEICGSEIKPGEKSYLVTDLKLRVCWVVCRKCSEPVDPRRVDKKK